MKIVRLLALLLVCCGYGVAPAQPPAEEKRIAERRGDPQDTPLDKLPVPGNGLIVVTPDLKKALDALGAGSVVLSAERYQELMNKVERKGDKPSQEILFSRCQISGEVKNVNGRELAELTFDLEFRTEQPGAVIPLPFKGIRISSASLNGEPPIWGPDPEKWSLIIKNPQVSRLKLSTSVPVTRVGQEKRLTLERVPASAITSLELLVPATVPSAMVLGYGSVAATTVGNGKTQLAAPALGVLSSLDLTWQVNEAGTSVTPPTLEGDIRLNLDETQAMVEARFKPVPFLPIQLPWKVRLPKNCQQVRAELIRSDAGNAESLVVTRQTDGLYQLNTPYALNTSGFSQVVIRWKQLLPDAESAEAVFLGSCEIVEPAGRQQTGIVQLTLPDDAPALLRPKQLIILERPFLVSDRESRRVQRYRYQQQPAGLEAVSLPRQLAQGVIEARLNHSLTAMEGGWLLATEIEILRSTRSNLAVLELSWPADWPVSRKLLFSPAVKEIEQDTMAERVKVIMDGRQPEALTLKVESILPASFANISVKLPQLLSALSKQQERSTPIDVIIQQERFKLDANGWELQLSPNSSGLREEAQDALSRKDSKWFQVIGRPAQLTVNRQPRLPKWTSKVDVFVGKEMLKTRQTIDVRWMGSSLRKLHVVAPRSVKNVQFMRLLPDGRTGETLVSKGVPGDDGIPWKQWVVELPASTERSCSVLCVCEQEAAHPITVPLFRIDEAEATLDGSVTIQCVNEDGLKLTMPNELPGWKVEKQEGHALEITGSSLQPLLVLDRQEDTGTAKPLRLRHSEIKLEEEGASWLVELEATFSELRTTGITLQTQASRSDVDLIGWKLDNRLMSESDVRWGGDDGKVNLRFKIPADQLMSNTRLSVALRLKRDLRVLWQQAPSLVWETGAEKRELTPLTWLLRSEPSQWLWWSSLRADERVHAQHGWVPTSPHAVGGTGQPAFFCFQSTVQSESLKFIVVPRSVSVMLMSGLAFVLIRILARHTERRALTGWIVAFGLLLLFIIEPGTAAVLCWSAMPGVVLALLLKGWERIRQQTRQRKTVVFLSNNANSSTMIRPAPSPSRTILPDNAPTIVTSSPQASRS